MNIEVRSNTQDPTTKEFSPLLTKGQVVDCDFIGQGTVLDKRHYGVVWAADRKTEHIIVIPLTSKDRSGIAAPFSLGVIDGLDEPGDEKDSIAKVNQPQSISRKSVYILTKKVTEGGREPIRLSDLQLKKMIDIFRAYHLKEPYLRDVLEGSCGYTIPSSPISLYREILNRPVQYVINNNQLLVKTHDSEIWTTIVLTKVNGYMNNRQRKQYLAELFSGDIAREAMAENAVIAHLAASSKESPDPT